MTSRSGRIAIGCRRHHRSAGADAASRHDHGVHHLRDAAPVARPDHCQCRAALHAGQLLRELRRDHLGADRLHHGGRDHDGASRMAGGTLRPQAAVRDMHHRLHHHLDAVRRRAIAGTDRRVPPHAGRVQRRAGAAVAGDPVRYLSGGTPRFRHGGLGNGRDDRTDPGPDARWLPDRHLQLALRLLYQPAVRRARDARVDPVHARARWAENSAL